MAENSHISWTDGTFNPWWGCTKVSAACDNCYAETLARRFGTDWGKDAPRKFFGGKHWNEPLKWDRKAGERGERRRIFCASMADVFEDNDSLMAERARLWDLIEATPNLTWLLLTKRPHLMTRFAPERWADGWPVNVWAMTTVEDQTWADARIPWLMKVPAAVRGLSMEPLVGDVTLPADFLALGQSAWVITGGESGTGARPCPPDWYRHLRGQATTAGVPFHFKQWGEWLPADQTGGSEAARDSIVQIERAHYSLGRALPSAAQHVCTLPLGNGEQFCWRVGKVAAGRLLDDTLWAEFPAERTAA